MTETFPGAKFVSSFPPRRRFGRRDLNDDWTDRVKSISGALAVRAVAVGLAEASPPPFEPQVCDLGHGRLPKFLTSSLIAAVLDRINSRPAMEPLTPSSRISGAPLPKGGRFLDHRISRSALLS